jgi:hypothetical protein
MVSLALSLSLYPLSNIANSTRTLSSPLPLNNPHPSPAPLHLHPRLHAPSLTLPNPFHIRNRTLQRARQIDMKEGSIQAMHNSHTLRRLNPASIRLTIREGFVQIHDIVHLLIPMLMDVHFPTLIELRDRATSLSVKRLHTLFVISGVEPFEGVAVLLVFSGGGGGGGTADLSDAEDGLPAAELLGGEGEIAEAGGDEGALGPAVVDAGDVPLDGGGGGVAVELVADVDEVLDGGDVDVIDGGEVEDDGFEGGEVAAVWFALAAFRARVIPRSVAEP